MSADLSEAEALATPEFWNERYTKSDGSNPTHEWFRTFAALEPYFQKHLFTQRSPETSPRIMHLGSGDSTIPADLSSRGYKNQLCLDFSQVVVDLMKARHEPVGGIEWRWADVRDMPDAAPTRSVDVAFDKGTMDAMIHGSPWSPPDDVRDNTGRYLREVHRALKDDGVFLYITYRQPHFMKPLLNSEGLWDLEMDVLSGGESAFDYYGFILRKKAQA
ncbi:EEF1A lysine methyltransferase 4 [Colletotrichum sp. SAR 10_70]|nr:EEF1A lysine methyltransferase 4 [Colletotrichum sp. SAR 10_71]KAI8158808.1 EEF1A lysine methyltransferase 4 [Colletotrichum sp. SAR 10_70]KAI8244960.1 EEF1A lysine methyltransferase 4 [Colletotrichum sp. SAR 10_96]KAI8294196.1 EEF1A lysine methyltransferase 4 [Colletotrichum sp. SAR 10_98]KAJ5019296.1 EEF1A lysine methyltransferase 4 [Colletotrichum sp. SAR 10_99]